MANTSHRFVEVYQGPVAFGLSREVDEASLIVYLQRFAADEVMACLRSRLSQEEIDKTVDWLTLLLRRHLSEAEYHGLFLGEG